jgi:hypothetical protein
VIGLGQTTEDAAAATASDLRAAGFRTTLLKGLRKIESVVARGFTCVALVFVPADAPMTAPEIADELRHDQAASASESSDGHIDGWAAGAAISVPACVTDRWVDAVLRIRAAENDVPRVTDWARLAGTSPSVLRTICRRCGWKTRDARDIGRLLRAVELSARSSCPPEVFLDAADPRTIARLLRRGGILPDGSGAESILLRQRFVSAKNFALLELRHALNRGRVSDT